MSGIEVENADLPNHLTIQQFAAARKREIQVMNNALSTTTAIKLAFQKLPRHMRRRAMSHNAKRLPRRLREIHLSQQMKSGLPPKQKRPSRKYRRRPYTLNTEYIRRQRRVTWLNTHIWHAKRFHMIEKWAYKIPYSPCDKAFRACYRATIKHCLLQDISYYSCMEILGEFNQIVDFFKQISDFSQGLTIAAKAYVGGLREGSVNIFRPDNKKIIGTFPFNWKGNCDNSNLRVLWIWCHAAYYEELLNMFVTCFEFKPYIDNSSTQKYSNNQLTINILKWDLARFRLTGPLSHAILQNAFKLDEGLKSSPDWVSNYFKKTTTDSFSSSHNYWEHLKSISSSAEVSPHIILPLIITDPRYNFPKQRTKAVPNEVPNDSGAILPSNFFESPIWNKDVRKLVKDSKISNAKLAELRQKLLVPGSELDVPPVPIPIILVHRAGRKQMEFRGYGNGWDIILPSSWAQPIWLSLVMWGARSGGLRENDSIIFESGSQHFLFPDSSAGEQEEKQISLKMRETFFKLPPNKRTNFVKFKISSPFDWNWKLLLSEWSENGNVDTDFFILRDKSLLKNVQDILSKKSKFVQLSIPENCLIPVQITLFKKGSCEAFAVICMPQESDLKIDPIEPDCNDPNEKERKEMRKDHKVLLKRLKRKRKKGKRKNNIIPIDKDMLRNYTSKMRKLWLPDTTNIRNSCSREVMGFVKKGDFSFLAGKCKAIGYITSGSLIKLLSAAKSRNKVLIRNTNSKQYRLGNFEIICD